MWLRVVSPKFSGGGGVQGLLVGNHRLTSFDQDHAAEMQRTETCSSVVDLECPVGMAEPTSFAMQSLLPNPRTRLAGPQAPAVGCPDPKSPQVLLSGTSILH